MTCRLAINGFTNGKNAAFGKLEATAFIVDNTRLTNYKTDDVASKLAEFTPNGVDIYFENTGGPIQNHVFERMNAHGRIVVCVKIADYASATPSAGPNWIPLIKKRISIRGFAMPDHFDEAPELLAKLTPYVMSGKIKYRSHILEGLETAMEGLNLFLTVAIRAS
jgi:NADPH-dependent curcumin reductase CurA